MLGANLYIGFDTYYLLKIVGRNAKGYLNEEYGVIKLQNKLIDER